MSRSFVPPRPLLSTGGAFVAVVLLAGCATSSGEASLSPTTAATSTASPAPTPMATVDPSPVPSEASTPVPESSASIGTDGATGTSVVFITLDAVGGRVEASGILPEIVEEGGTCTLTLVQGSQRRTVEGDTAAGPQSTYCSLLTLPTSELASGEWVATLSYASNARSGTSAPSTVSVP